MTRIRVVNIQNNTITISNGISTLAVTRDKLLSMINSDEYDFYIHKVQCINKIRNNKGIIIKYVLSSCEGHFVFNISPEELKTYIYNLKYDCVNLKLTSDWRLIDKKGSDSDNKPKTSKNKNENSIMYEIRTIRKKLKLLGHTKPNKYIFDYYTKKIDNLEYIIKYVDADDSIKYINANKALRNPQYSAIVTDMQGLFKSVEAYELDLSEFITENVTTMSGMFENKNGLVKLNLSSFDTSNVTTMFSMFSNCTNIRELDLSSFNTSNVVNMASMFNNCSSLKHVRLKSFDTSKVMHMCNMFSDCSNIEELDLSNFNTAAVNIMSSMFYNCIKLKKLNLSSFNTRNVSVMNNMFYSCKSLKSLNLSNFYTDKLQTTINMFNGCEELCNLDISNFSTKEISNMEHMFANCYKLRLDISHFELPIKQNELIVGDIFHNVNMIKIKLPDWMKSYINKY